MNAGWIPSPVEVEMYEPKLTNAYMTFTVFALPNIVHRKNGVGDMTTETEYSRQDAKNVFKQHLASIIWSFAGVSKLK